MAIQCFPLDSDNNESIKYTSAVLGAMLGPGIRRISSANVTVNTTTREILVTQFRGIANGLFFNITGEKITAPVPVANEHYALIYTVNKAETKFNGVLSLKKVEPSAYTPAYTDAGSTEIFIGTYNGGKQTLLVHDSDTYVLNSPSLLVTNFKSFAVDTVCSATQNNTAVSLRLSTPYTYQRRDLLTQRGKAMWTDTVYTPIKNGDNVATTYSTLMEANISKYFYSTLRVSTSAIGTNVIGTLGVHDETNNYLVNSTVSGNGTNKATYAFYKLDEAKIANLKMTITGETTMIVWQL